MFIKKQNSTFYVNSIAANFILFNDIFLTVAFKKLFEKFNKEILFIYKNVLFANLLIQKYFYTKQKHMYKHKNFKIFIK